MFFVPAPLSECPRVRSATSNDWLASPMHHGAGRTSRKFTERHPGQWDPFGSMGCLESHSKIENCKLCMLSWDAAPYIFHTRNGESTCCLSPHKIQGSLSQALFNEVVAISEARLCTKRLEVFRKSCCAPQRYAPISATCVLQLTQLNS